MTDTRARTGFIKNVLQNAVATAIPLLVLQLFILPNIGERMSSTAYGLMLTLVGVVTLVSLPAGGSISNVRLLLNLEYEEKGYRGDFNQFLSLMSGIGVTAVIIVTLIYDQAATFGDIIGVAVIGLLAIVYQYALVGFRLTLSYDKIAINSVIQTLGYLVGYLLFLITDRWYWIYIAGYGLSNIFILYCTGLLKEPWKRTPLFRTAAEKTAVLALASLLTSSISYIDRLVLYPILGGEAVTVYYVATLLGKIICVAVNPITGVMLSYFSRMKHLKMSTVTLMLACSAVVGTIGYFGCMVISRFVLTRMYPQVVDEVMNYIGIATLTCVVDMIVSVLNPVVLRFCNTNWQLAIGTFNVVSYLLIVLTLMSRFGLLGFCYGALIAVVLKLILMLLVFVRSDRKQRTEASAQA